MERTFYTIEIGAVEIGCEYPCYWTDALSGSQFSKVKDAVEAAQGLGCQWWRVVEHIETEVVVAKSPRYLECCVE